jgi:extracellular factor (EF) 3-hydroxypalmitic acid methyl ester biosynthesis protein
MALESRAACRGVGTVVSLPKANTESAMSDPRGTGIATAFVRWLRSVLQNLPVRADEVGRPAAIAEALAALEALHSYQCRLPEPTRAILRERFREEVRPLFLEAEVTRYAAARPRGYPGDFGAMERIWKGRTLPQTHSALGRTPLGRLLNQVVLELANCIANEERVYILARRIGQLRPGAVLASIGSGSAIEISYACRQSPCPSLRKVHLFDLDDGAHAAARKQLAQWGIDPVCHHGDAVKEILTYADEPFDLAYSSGMFDYFQLPWARRLVALIWPKIASRGALVVTNAHPDNPTRTIMEWVCDWPLQYKTEADLLSLAEGLPDLASARVTRDGSQVYQYLELLRTSGLTLTAMRS